MRGLSLVVASGGHSSLQCSGLSLSRPLLLLSTGSRRAGSAIVAHGPSCSAACGILPDQGSNPCPLQWQADSQPLRHQGSPCPAISILSALQLPAMELAWLLHPHLRFPLPGSRPPPRLLSPNRKSQAGEAALFSARHSHHSLHTFSTHGRATGRRCTNP